MIKGLFDSEKLTLSFTGHRPGKLGGYNLHSAKNNAILKEIELHLEVFLLLGYRRFISGGALGGDTIFWIACNNLKKKYKCISDEIENVLAIPFEDQPKRWINQEDIDFYEHMKISSDRIVYVDKQADYYIIGSTIGKWCNSSIGKKKLDKRNAFMVDHSNCVLSLWSGSSGGTCNCIDYIKSIKKEYVNINPYSIMKTI